MVKTAWPGTGEESNRDTIELWGQGEETLAEIYFG